MTKKILLVDDDRDIHEHVRVIAEKAGYRFSSAYDGDDGLTKLINEHPDLIILDFKMPLKNGLETYKAIKSLPKYSNIPVIMLTACDQSQEDIEQLLKHGLNAYLEKPFGHRELLNVIKNTFVTNEIKIRNAELAKEIEESKNFLENLVASCPLAIITTNNEGKITFVSKAMETIIGLAPNEILGSSLAQLLGLDDHFVCELNRQINDGNPILSVEIEFWVNSNQNRSIPMRTTFSQLKDKADNLKGLLVVGEDLSDQKRLELERLEKERLQAIMESMATINHQINNPLTPILGNIQLIKKEETDLSETLKRRIDAIEANAKRITQLIQAFNQMTLPIKRKYYGKTHFLDVPSDRLA